MHTSALESSFYCPSPSLCLYIVRNCHFAIKCILENKIQTANVRKIISVVIVFSVKLFFFVFLLKIQQFCFIIKLQALNSQSL